MRLVRFVGAALAPLVIASIFASAGAATLAKDDEKLLVDGATDSSEITVSDSKSVFVLTCVQYAVGLMAGLPGGSGEGGGSHERELAAVQVQRSCKARLSASFCTGYANLVRQGAGRAALTHYCEAAFRKSGTKGASGARSSSVGFLAREAALSGRKKQSSLLAVQPDPLKQGHSELVEQRAECEDHLKGIGRLRLPHSTTGSVVTKDCQKRFHLTAGICGEVARLFVLGEVREACQLAVPPKGPDMVGVCRRTVAKVADAELEGEALEEAATDLCTMELEAASPAGVAKPPLSRAKRGCRFFAKRLASEKSSGKIDITAFCNALTRVTRASHHTKQAELRPGSHKAYLPAQQKAMVGTQPKLAADTPVKRLRAAVRAVETFDPAAVVLTTPAPLERAIASALAPPPPPDHLAIDAIVDTIGAADHLAVASTSLAFTMGTPQATAKHTNPTPPVHLAAGGMHPVTKRSFDDIAPHARANPTTDLQRVVPPWSKSPWGEDSNAVSSVTLHPSASIKDKGITSVHAAPVTVMPAASITTLRITTHVATSLTTVAPTTHARLTPTTSLAPVLAIKPSTEAAAKHALPTRAAVALPSTMAPSPRKVLERKDAVTTAAPAILRSVTLRKTTRPPVEVLQTSTLPPHNTVVTKVAKASTTSVKVPVVMISPKAVPATAAHTKPAVASTTAPSSSSDDDDDDSWPTFPPSAAATGGSGVSRTTSLPTTSLSVAAQAFKHSTTTHPAPTVAAKPVAKNELRIKEHAPVVHTEKTQKHSSSTKMTKAPVAPKVVTTAAPRHVKRALAVKPIDVRVNAPAKPMKKSTPIPHSVKRKLTHEVISAPPHQSQARTSVAPISASHVTHSRATSAAPVATSIAPAATTHIAHLDKATTMQAHGSSDEDSDDDWDFPAAAASQLVGKSAESPTAAATVSTTLLKSTTLAIPKELKTKEIASETTTSSALPTIPVVSDADEDSGADSPSTTLAPFGDDEDASPEVETNTDDAHHDDHQAVVLKKVKTLFGSDTSAVAAGEVAKAKEDKKPPTSFMATVATQEVASDTPDEDNASNDFLNNFMEQYNVNSEDGIDESSKPSTAAPTPQASSDDSDVVSLLSSFLNTQQKAADAPSLS